MRQLVWLLVGAVLLLGGRLLLGTHSRPAAADSPTPTIATTATATSAPACRAADLTAHGGREGENAGGVHGDVLFTNTGASPCVLAGLPTSIQLVQVGGSVLATRLRQVASDLVRVPVVLEPQAKDSADLTIFWSNWCGAPPGPLRIRVVLAGHRGAVTAPFDGPPGSALVPPCLQHGHPSMLQVLEAFVPGAISR